MSTMKNQELTFKKTIYVEQRITFERFKDRNFFYGFPRYFEESEEQYHERVLKIWNAMCERADEHGQVNVDHLETDEDDNDYDCEFEIEEMALDMKYKINREEKDMTRCDHCEEEMEFKELTKCDEKWLCSKCEQYF